MNEEHITVEVQQGDFQLGILALLDAAHRAEGEDISSLRQLSPDKLRAVAERLRRAQPPVLVSGDGDPRADG